MQIQGDLPHSRIPAIHVADPSAADHQLSTPRAEAIAVASERYTQMLEEQGTPQPSTEILFDPNTGQPLNVHHHLGAYAILKELGKGDMATTYLGWCKSQTFALKQLNLEWSQNRDALTRFQRQARQLKDLTHPGVPQVVDGFMDQNQPVIVTEMVYGKTLQQEVQAKGPLAKSDAIALALEVCDVLAELHSQAQPVIHGDLHPRHIMRRQILRSGQEIVLTDFGSVRHYAWALGLTSRSAGYTAPELEDVVSHPERVTPAIDIYALGTTLAYLLTGEEPSTVYGHHETGYRFQPEYLPGLDADTIALLQHLTHPIAEQRPQSIADLAQTLRQMI